MDIHKVTKEKLDKGLLTQQEYEHIVGIPLPPDATDEPTTSSSPRRLPATTNRSKSRSTSGMDPRKARQLFESLVEEFGEQGYLVRAVCKRFATSLKPQST